MFVSIVSWFLTATWRLLLWHLLRNIFAFNHLWNRKTLWPLSFKCARRRLGEEVKATLCVFAQQCVQPASESASGQAKGRTAHQRIHRTTECFLGGGWDSEREGSKKSPGNYLQLWACFCAISHTIFYCGSGCNCECCRIKSATVTWQWFELLQIVNCEG